MTSCSTTPTAWDASVHTDAAAVMVDFRNQTVRIPSPFNKMTKL